MQTLPLFPDDDTDNEDGYSSESSPYSVIFLTSYIKSTLEDDDKLQDVWVEGEVSNLSRPSSGHIYFTLKDADAQLRCVMWRSDAERLKFDLKNNDQILTQGKIGLYEKGGQYQLYARKVQPVGAGDLNRQLQLLYAKLNAEGLFDAKLKKSLPILPTKIGIVTSASTAAFQDALNVLRRRFPLAHVILSPTPVQGDEAPPKISQAIQALNDFTDVEVILLIRGGGSLEDLWCFNDERVVRAVVSSKIPVVTGVGHEIDHTLVDYASDFRAPTPSAAAEVIVPDRQTMQATLVSWQDRAYNAVATIISEKNQKVTVQQRALKHLSPQSEVDNARQRTDDMTKRLERAMKNQLVQKKQQMLAERGRLQSNDPMGILARGYAIVSRQGDGRRLTHAIEAAPGTMLHIRLHDGTLNATVKERAVPVVPPVTRPVFKKSGDKSATV